MQDMARPDLSVLIAAHHLRHEVPTAVASVFERSAGAAVEVVIASDDGTDYAEVLPDPDADVAGAYEEKRRQQVLMDCIEALSPPQRACMQLVFLEGLALAEIAEIQQVPEGTVKTRLFHGRRNLRDCVQAHGEGESS